MLFIVLLIWMIQLAYSHETFCDGNNVTTVQSPKSFFFVYQEFRRFDELIQKKNSNQIEDIIVLNSFALFLLIFYEKMLFSWMFSSNWMENTPIDWLYQIWMTYPVYCISTLFNCFDVSTFNQDLSMNRSIP